MQKTINFRFLIVLLIVTAITGASVHFVHAWQARKQADTFLKLADAAQKAGNPRRAYDLLSRYLALFPDNTEVRARMGMILARAARNGEQRYQAFFWLERVLREDRQHENDDVRRRDVRLAIDLGYYDKAIQHLNILKKAHENEGELYDLIGQCQVAQGEFDKAEKSFLEAIEKTPTFVSAYGDLAALRRRHLSKEQEADEVINGLLKENPQSGQAHMIAASYWKTFDRLDVAEAEIDKALKLAAEDPKVLLAAAGVAMSQAADLRLHGNYVEAEEKEIIATARRHLQLAIDKNQPPVDNPTGTEEEQDEIAAKRTLIAELYHQIVGLEIRTGRLAEAETLARAGVEHLPERAEVQLGLADAYICRNKLEDAERILKTVREIGYPEPIIEYHQARILAARDRWLDASQLLERIAKDLVVHPDVQRQANLLLANCYDPMGEMDRRYEAFARARPADLRDPLWAPASIGMASSHAELGRIAEAIELYKTVADYYPPVIIPLARLLFVETARKPVGERDWRPVANFLKLKQMPEGVETEVLRSDLQQMQGQTADAQKTLEQAKEKYPDAVEVWLAQALHAMGEKNTSAADKLLAAAEAKFGDRVEIRLTRARLLVAPLPRDGAAQLARLAEGIDKFSRPDRRRLLRGLADRAVELGARETASHLWDVLVVEQPDNLGIQYKRFNRALDTNDEGVIQRVLDDIRRIDGANGISALMARSLYLIWKARRGDKTGLKEALEILPDLEQKRPEWPAVPLAMAYVYEFKNDLDSAVRSYRRAVTLGERDPMAMQRLIELYYERDDFNDAQAVLRDAPPEVLAKESIQFIIAEISLASGKFERAAEMAEKAVTANVKDFRKHLWLAQVRWNSGRRAEAEAPFRKALELESSLPVTWMALMQYLVDMNRKPEAEKTFEQALQRIKKEEITLAKAQGSEILGQAKEASELYARALVERPDYAPALRSAVNFRLKQTDKETDLAEVKELLDRILQLKEKNRDDADFARRMLAVVYSIAPDYESSRRALELLSGSREEPLSKLPVDELRTRARGLSFQRGRRHGQEAVTVLETIDARRSLQNDDRFLLARLYDRLGNSDKALVQFHELVRQQPDNPFFVAWYVRILLQVDAANPEIDKWLKVLEKLEPDSFRTVELRARLLVAQNKKPEAVEKVLAFVKGGRPEIIGAAHLFEEINEFDRAEQLLKQGFADPKLPAVKLALAEFYGQQNRGREALDTLENISRLFPPQVVIGMCLKVLYSLDPPEPEQIKRARDLIKRIAPKGADLLKEEAALMNLEGNYDGALTYYRRLLEREPNNLLAINNSAFLIAFHEKNTADALKLIQKTKTMVKPLTVLLDTEAVIDIAQGDTDAAIELLLDALTDEPTAAYYYHLAQAYAAAEKDVEAANAMARARKLNLRRTDLHPLEYAAFEKLRRQFVKKP